MMPPEGTALTGVNTTRRLFPGESLEVIHDQALGIRVRLVVNSQKAFAVHDSHIPVLG